MSVFGSRTSAQSTGLTLKAKITLSLCSIAIILLISSIISVLEYRRMSSYVSGSIARNLSNINTARNLAETANAYNLEILTVIGDETLNDLPDINQKAFVAHCDSLRSALGSGQVLPMLDSVLYSYSAYMLTSLELNSVILSDFIDSRSWYFERLQPRFKSLRDNIYKMEDALSDELKKSSEQFDRGIYRSIVPGFVAVGVGLLLVLMLLFFILVYYVNPIYRMLDALKNYRLLGRKYNVEFDGDDQLSELNEGIQDLVDSNLQMRRRITSLKQQSGDER